MFTIQFVPIQPNIELKTVPKQLLGSLPLAIALPWSFFPCFYLKMVFMAKCRSEKMSAWANVAAPPFSIKCTIQPVGDKLNLDRSLNRALIFLLPCLELLLKWRFLRSYCHPRSARYARNIFYHKIHQNGFVICVQVDENEALSLRRCQRLSKVYADVIR